MRKELRKLEDKGVRIYLEYTTARQWSVKIADGKGGYFYPANEFCEYDWIIPTLQKLVKISFPEK